LSVSKPNNAQAFSLLRSFQVNQIPWLSEKNTVAGLLVGFFSGKEYLMAEKSRTLTISEVF
jgi:hypothetical protein